jgi:hypothetical protein
MGAAMLPNQAHWPGGIFNEQPTPFIVDIRHPVIREEYQKRRLDVGGLYSSPLSDIEQAIFDLDMIQKYAVSEEMPDWVYWMLQTPLYRQAQEEQKKRIKK